MKLKLDSEIFKSLYNSEEIDTSILRDIVEFSDDSNVRKISDSKQRRAALQDYYNITNNMNLKRAIFYELSEDVVVEALKIKAPEDLLTLNAISIDISSLRDIDLHTIGNLSLFSIKSKDDKPHVFENISQMQDLTCITVNNSPGIDINKLFDDIPNPESVGYITIGQTLPSTESLSRFTNLRSVTIMGVSDEKSIERFLELLPLKNVVHFKCFDCNLNRVNTSIIKRLESVQNIELLSNQNANYNQILDELPNKSILESFLANASVQPKQNGEENIVYNFEANLLKQFPNLKSFSLANLNVDLDKLHESLLQLQNLENLKIGGIFLRDLDFIDGVNTEISLQIDNSCIDLRRITPEIASKFKKIICSDRDRKLETVRQPDGYSLSLDINAGDLFAVDNLLEAANQTSHIKIEVARGSNGINQILGFINRDKCPEGCEILIEDYSNERVEELLRNDIVSSVIVADRTNDDRYDLKRFTYDKDEYIQIEDKIKEITQGIPEDMPDVEKFMIIYRRLGSMIRYDYGIIGNNKYSQYAKDNIDNCRNAKNGLLRNTCVCAGYADILYNCLREVGIDSYKVTGVSGEYHQWNKVVIDGNLYNTDLTWDADALAQANWRKVSYCLLGDNPFNRSHKPLHGFLGECKASYDRIKLKKAWKRALEFDNINSKRTTLFEKIKNRLFSKNKLLSMPEHIDTSEGTDLEDTNSSKTPSWVLTEEEVKKYNQQALGISNTKDDLTIQDRESSGQDR